MRKFTWLSYVALITSLYPILYYQMSIKYEQDYDLELSPFEPVWLVLCFIGPFLSLATIYLGTVQNDVRKELGVKEENPWMYRISIILIMLTVFLYLTQVSK